MLYHRNKWKDLIDYTDSDYANDIDDTKRTSIYVFMMSEVVISWSSKKQSLVSLSTTEAKFIVTAISFCQVVWLRKILESMRRNQTIPTIIYFDNISII